MHHNDPVQVAQAKMLFQQGLDKLMAARDRLAAHKVEPGPIRADELNTVIIGIEAILEVL